MAADENRSDTPPPAGFSRMRKILIVDRDPFFGPAIRLALEEAGYYPNLVAEPREGCRRVLERAYDLVIVSASEGLGALQAILELVSRRVTPPSVIILASEEALELKEAEAVPSLTILRRPCAVEKVVDEARALVGAPWSDHRKGA